MAVALRRRQPFRRQDGLARHEGLRHQPLDVDVVGQRQHRQRSAAVDDGLLAQAEGGIDNRPGRHLLAQMYPVLDHVGLCAIGCKRAAQHPLGLIQPSRLFQQTALLVQQQNAVTVRLQ